MHVNMHKLYHMYDVYIYEYIYIGEYKSTIMYSVAYDIVYVYEIV